MKKIASLFTILLLPMVASASDGVDYLPFVELGKQWHVVSATATSEHVCRLKKYVMSENVERDGKTYARTYCSEDELCEYHEEGLFREENRRVYKYDETVGRDIMLYDFSLKEGDTFTYEFGLDQPVSCKVLKQGWLNDGPKIVSSYTLNPADTFDIKYRRLRTWTIGRDNGLGKFDEFATWVECVGSLENPLRFKSFSFGESKSCLAYVERTDSETDYPQNDYLPFSFCGIYDVSKRIHGCNLPTGEADHSEDWHHQLTYELEGDRLHVHGKVLSNCGPNNYSYFYEKKTDDPLVNKIEFVIEAVEPIATCIALHATDFFVPGFDPNMNYIVVDNHGEEHPVINKTPQMAYRPFVENGKVWKVADLTSGNPVQLVQYYYFDGDTIINGKNCKPMMYQEYVDPVFAEANFISQYDSKGYEGAWYEEDKKVYFYDTTDKQFRMMYDFSLGTNDTLQINSYQYVVGPRQTGGIKGFKGVYREVRMCADGENINSIPWLEGIGSTDRPMTNVYPGYVNPLWALMSCSVGDEVIYLNEDYEDGATPAGARKGRFDFTHTIKTRPKAPRRSVVGHAIPTDAAGKMQSLYGEYNALRLDINLAPLDEAYLVSITDELGQAVYEKAVNTGSVVALNIDISAYAKGRYTVTVENSRESFTGQFETLPTGIGAVNNHSEMSNHIYNLQGQRLSSLQKGLNIVNGQKYFVK